ncbi:hypothetical protein SO694_000681101 [Aureococcus anophagefferens]|uniref:AAA+ ATPase domain-containing protein n=1 Tax=Aureococcus anophagefferens TaxID=44056 RepID=A0ABR1FPW3_AURAN
MERSARAVAWLVVVARASAYCGCSNAVPASETVATLERSFATRVAGRERLAQRILSLARSHASARAAGRSAPLRLHLTGPSGVGKSFLAELVANSFFEESALHRYAAAGAGRATAALRRRPRRRQGLRGDGRRRRGPARGGGDGRGAAEAAAAAAAAGGAAAARAAPAAAVVVLTSDLYGGPDAGDFLLEEGMGVEDAAAVVEAQGARMCAARRARVGRATSPLALPPLDGAELDAAIALYLRHDVARAVHDALRFAFAELRVLPNSSAGLGGADAPEAKVDGRVLLRCRRVARDAAAFVRRGPADWRAHGITHFRHAVLEPELEAAARALLEKSRVRVDEPVVRVPRDRGDDPRPTSSLLLRTAERRVNPNTPYERVVVDVTWDVEHLPARSFMATPASRSRACPRASSG